MHHQLRVTGPGLIPSKAYEDDAGLDLYTYVEDSDRNFIGVAPGSFVDVPCGISVELPANTFGMITGRSSTLRKRGLLVAQGIIDVGYRGELFAGVWNLSHRWAEIKSGERLAQLLILPTWAIDVVRVDSLSEHPRGTSGFGSTGT